MLDPTLIGQLETAGYADSLEGRKPAPLADALDAAPTRRPALPNQNSEWSAIEVKGTFVSRPAGVRIDSGGVGKGLAADAAAVLLSDRERFCVSAGGDLRIGGPDAATNPYPVSIDDPFGGSPLVTLRVGSGAVATSGIGSRIWQNANGGFAHHLINPSTGEPAWTGLVQVSALAPTALEAETIAKRVILTGPGGIGMLERHGGVVVDDTGRVELVGSVAHSTRRLTLN